MNTYTHQPYNQDIKTTGRSVSQKEVRLDYNGREVLYIVSEKVVVDASRCGVDVCRIAVVPGYVISWHTETDKDGLPVSKVEPVPEETLDDIRKAIMEREWVESVEFC
jgi:hypothetical protein